MKAKEITISDEQIHDFQSRILGFYKSEGRSLPWRKTNDPYHILLSEVMLQQTQVSRVIDYYERWVERWPTLNNLADASRSDVLKMWLGLGYNNRGMRLHMATRIIINEYHGDIICAMKEYEKIPGIGRYTSQAVLIFSENAEVVTVDANIRRILIYEFNLKKDVSEEQLWTIAKQCLPKGKSRVWHNALMDYGALVLTSRRTGIHSRTRQSRFEGSDRQIRAGVLRLLLQSSMDLDSIKGGLDVLEPTEARLVSVLEGMRDNGLILCRNGRYEVKEEEKTITPSKDRKKIN